MLRRAGSGQGHAAGPRATGATREARRRGQALVEAAFVVVVLITLTLGLIQFGILFNASETLTSICRDGARFAAVHGAENPINYKNTLTAPDAAIRLYLQDTATGTSIGRADLPDANIAVSPPAGDPGRKASQPITVTLTYDMTKKLFLPSFLPGVSHFGSNYQVSATMVIEGV